MRHLRTFAVVAGTLALAATGLRAGPQADQGPPAIGYVAWSRQIREQMLKLNPGMSRADLLQAFTTEGGLSTALRRRFVSRLNPYLKVDVEFQPVGRPARDAEGRMTSIEDPRDIIVTISQPYFQSPIYD